MCIINSSSYLPAAIGSSLMLKISSASIGLYVCTLCCKHWIFVVSLNSLSPSEKIKCGPIPLPTIDVVEGGPRACISTYQCDKFWINLIVPKTNYPSPFLRCYTLNPYSRFFILWHIVYIWIPC